MPMRVRMPVAVAAVLVLLLAVVVMVPVAAVAVAVLLLDVIHRVELPHDGLGLGQLCEIDLPAAHELEHDLAELGERVLAAPAGAHVVEPGSALARGALEGVADDAGLLEGRAQESAEGSTQLGRTEPAASLSRHACKLSSLSRPGSLSYRRNALHPRWSALASHVARATRRPTLALGLGLLVAGCPPPEPPAAPIPPVSTGKVRVRVFTEPSPVKALASAGRFVFVGTENHLERWDGNGGVLPLSAEHGLTGNQIAALASDPERRWMWVLTDVGLGYYDANTEVYREQIAPPVSMGIDFTALARDGASLAAARDGGVWMGTTTGLIYVSAQGGWASTPIKEPIRALARDRADWLWVATHGGLIARKPSGETVRIGPAQGNAVVDPRLLVELPGGHLLVIGTDEGGHERLAIGKQMSWTTYRALPEVKWDAAAR
ncbi:MAG: hypothetical protein ACTHU0_34215, partial [Kofleriaceae bacterium]